MSIKVLIIDDDEEANRLLLSYLRQFEIEAVAATGFETAYPLIRAKNPDLILLDIMLPKKNGFDICRELRRTSATPIIMVTARGELGDRVVGLEVGADDYLAKPYEPRELVARIHAVLRRTQGHLKKMPRRRVAGNLIVNYEKASAHLFGKDLELTAMEFAVLTLLMDNAGSTVSREDIYQTLRGTDWDGADRAADMIVSRLRTKLGDDSKNAVFLKTMWGDGYRFVQNVSDE